MSGRAVPFHCPYCGDEDLRPHQAEDAGVDGAPASSHGQWECRSCLRAFKLSMIGQLRRPTTTPTTRRETSR